MKIPEFNAIDNIDLKVEILRQTLVQIQKDFTFVDSEFDAEVALVNSYQELFEKIHPHVHRMLDLDPNRFFNLIYRIDLDEKKVKEVLFGKNTGNSSQVITELILQRELKKVMLRMYLKNHF